MKKIIKKVMTVATILVGLCSLSGCDNDASRSKRQEEKETYAVSVDVLSVKKDVVYEKDGVEITIKGMEYGYLGPEINYVVKNDSDKEICVQVRNSSVNGIVVDFSASTIVEPGEESELEPIYIHEEELLKKDITVIDDIEFVFCVFDNNKKYSMGFYAYKCSDIVKLSFKNKGYEQEIKEGEVIYNSDDVTVSAIGIVESPFDHYHKDAIQLYVENKTGKDIELDLPGEISINGNTIGTYYTCFLEDGIIPAGKGSYVEVCVWENHFPEDETMKSFELLFYATRYEIGDAGEKYTPENVFKTDKFGYEFK